MAVPTYDRFIEPILRYLAQHPQGSPAPAAHEAAAEMLGLTETDKAILLPSGKQRVYKNRAGWAHDRLKRAGLSSSPRHGYWKLTAEGDAFAKTHPTPLPEPVLQKLAMQYLGVTLKPSSGSDGRTQATQPLSPPTNAVTATPDDQLEQALAELRRVAADELLERLANASPSFFEGIVLDVLHKMGYGATPEDLTRVGGPHDGGIDGVISLDRLGLEKVYVQAKRWQSIVGRPELQAFYGALAGQKAKKGVFITTSSFSPHASDFAKSVEGIVLVDGNRLASLMIEFEVGVVSKTIRIPKIDSDYFDEEGS